MIYIKRVYDDPSEKDGFRILVDRLWPRGLKKEDAAVDQWAKEIAPSSDLRKWFNHEQEKWQDFRRRYKAELEENEALKDLMEHIKSSKQITLLYAAHDEEHNHAVVLKDFLEKSK